MTVDQQYHDVKLRQILLDQMRPNRLGVEDFDGITCWMVGDSGLAQHRDE